MRHSFVVSILLATLALGACAQVPTGLKAGGSLRQGAAIAARAEAGDHLLADVGEQAKQLEMDIEATYISLGLNTAAGRKLTPAKEGALKAGLAPFLATLDARIAGCLAKLKGDERYADVVAELEKRKPLFGDAMPDGATASELLYRLAQYRLKVGVLIEYAVRQGAVLD
jgi:hypothetical protein